ncbi:tripartite motif-containing protein 35-like [Electrophorus electricus]|uniref:tripartite motif-containing protein 35-like n=1 Tax=Electrophorus electricus TaxID=8005 RepID=UPI000F09A825|nr:tripartite motif-containing protein 35-like [Electrophorus electricus]
MASKQPFSDEDFTCPVCCDIFKDPVLLSCTHSVCRGCVRRYWSVERSQRCPLCRKQSARNPPLNLALRNLCRTFLEVREDPEVLCDIHSEKLKLFCCDDGQLACVVCRDSSKHQSHRFSPVDEAADELKDIIKRALKSMTKKVRNLQEARFNCYQKVDHIKQQAQYVRNRTEKEFDKLHQFLQKEHRAIVTKLKEEVQLKTQMLEKDIAIMNKEARSLSKTINEISKELECEDVKFIKSFEKTLKKARCTQVEPDEVYGELIDITNYLGNLQFRVWKKMKKIIKYSESGIAQVNFSILHVK